MRGATHLLLLVLMSALAMVSLGCTTSDDDDNDSADDDDTGDDDAGDDDDGLCDPEAVECVDDIILDLSLHDDKVSEGATTSTADGDSFVSIVDATAGGYQNAADNPFIYLRFDEGGLTKVNIDDETALESQEWHVAARRFIIRLNGGSSGPSCVAAHTYPEMTYDGLTEVPDGTVYSEDDYYSMDCTLINDSSGLEGSPQVVLSPWWHYQDCVATTGVPALIELDDGRVVRFVVEAYYESNQDNCNDNHMPGTTSAMYTWRWGFVN
jgi:HmuY protein